MPMLSKVIHTYDTQSSGCIRALVDSIDCRNDLTRVYVRLKGVPHTSSRIDNVTMQAESTILTMNDIDGVDVKRWFQWEDSPYIPIEIDFAPLKKQCERLVFTISTPNGNATWVATETKNKNK